MSDRRAIGEFSSTSTPSWSCCLSFCIFVIMFCRVVGLLSSYHYLPYHLTESLSWYPCCHCLFLMVFSCLQQLFLSYRSECLLLDSLAVFIRYIRKKAWDNTFNDECFVLLLLMLRTMATIKNKQSTQTTEA